MIRLSFTRVKPDQEARLRAWLAELNAYWKTLHATVERMGA